MLKHKKITIAIVMVFTTFIYTQFLQKETRAQEPLVTPDPVAETDTPASNQTGREILALLADLKSVRLDDGIFSNPEFQALQDTSVELSPEPVGRPNPFAPLGKDTVLTDDFKGFATASPRNIPFKSAASSTNTIVVPIGI